MRTLNGLPTKESGCEISFLPDKEGLRIVQTVFGAGDDPLVVTVCKINFDLEKNTLDHMGRQIVDLIREARDIGFEQGREYIVKALGPSLKSCKEW
jgi:hypothetical protein